MAPVHVDVDTLDVLAAILARGTKQADALLPAPEGASDHKRAKADEAFEVARSGRPGPVVVDLPKDILTSEHGTYSGPDNVAHRTYKPQIDGDPAAINQAVEQEILLERQPATCRVAQEPQNSIDS